MARRGRSFVQRAASSGSVALQCRHHLGDRGGNAVPHAQVAATLSVVAGGTRHPQGYELTITPEGIHAVASTPAGIFYAVCTLVQLLGIRDQGSGDRFRSQESAPTSNLQPLTSNFHPPHLRLARLPQSRRDARYQPQSGAYHADVAGTGRPPGSWKTNQLQLYTEHTFAYRNHPKVWADASPMTGEEILTLDAYCRERFIELVPNQNAYGHMTRWLTHDRYRPLADAPDGCDTRWGHYDHPLSLCPVDPGSIELVRSIFDELLPHFSSRQFNIGATRRLTWARCAAKQRLRNAARAGSTWISCSRSIVR